MPRLPRRSPRQPAIGSVAHVPSSTHRRGPPARCAPRRALAWSKLIGSTLLCLLSAMGVCFKGSSCARGGSTLRLDSSGLTVSLGFLRLRRRGCVSRRSGGRHGTSIARDRRRGRQLRQARDAQSWRIRVHGRHANTALCTTAVLALDARRGATTSALALAPPVLVTAALGPASLHSSG